MLARLTALVKSDPTWLELVSTAFLAIWSGLLLLPYSTFDTSRSYAPLKGIVNETTWGFIALFLAALGLSGLIRNHLATRRAAVIGGQFFWGSVGACMVMGNPGGTGGWVYLLLAQACMVVYLVHGRR